MILSTLDLGPLAKLAGPGAMRIGYVTERRLDGLRSTAGEKLLRPEVYATLNVVP